MVRYSEMYHIPAGRSREFSDIIGSSGRPVGTVPVNLYPGLCYPRKVIRLQDVIFASLYAIIPAIDNQSSKLVDSWVQRYQVPKT